MEYVSGLGFLHRGGYQRTAREQFLCHIGESMQHTTAQAIAVPLNFSGKLP